MALPDLIDGNWVDIGSLATGMAYMVYCYWTDPLNTKFFSKQNGLVFANGAALFPLFLMVGCVVSSWLVKALLEASKMSLAVAGFFALCAILEKQD